jgi:glycosyltransferase involved in cell wall biosynthesis
MNNHFPLVSIDCITYNHERYLRRAIDGFLMQITSFPFEILIHDDASTDGTAAIIRDYEMKYPEILFPIYQKENQYSKGINVNATYQWPRARGKYIAFCEGDDYWIDPYKLQRQADFLQEYPEYGMITTDIELINESGEIINDNETVINQRLKRKPEINFYDLLNDFLVNTPTVFANAHLIKIIGERIVDRNLWFMRDYGFWLQISQEYKIKLFYEKTAAYRIHSNGISQSEANESLDRTSFMQWDAIKCFLRKNSFLSESEKHIIVRCIFNLLYNKRLPITVKMEILYYSITIYRYLLSFIKMKLKNHNSSLFMLLGI